MHVLRNFFFILIEFNSKLHSFSDFYFYIAIIIWLDEGGVSSDEEFSTGDGDAQDGQQLRGEDRELKDRLLRKFGSHIGTLKLEFSKKKKKGKLPKEARQTLLQWWNVHYKWPYPTVSTSLHASVCFIFIPIQAITELHTSFQMKNLFFF